MVHVLHKMPYNRRRKAYRLPQMIKRSFQQKLTAAFFCGWSEIDKRSKYKNKAVIREGAKQSKTKQKKENPENIKQIDKQSFRKRKTYNPQRRKEIDRQSFRKRKAENPEHIRKINRNAKLKSKETEVTQLF